MKILLSFFEKDSGNTSRVFVINKEQLKFWHALNDELDLEYLLGHDGTGFTISFEDECRYIDVSE